MFKPKNILGIAVLAGAASFLAYSLLLYPVRTLPTPARLADSPRFAGEAGAPAKRVGGEDKNSLRESGAPISQSQRTRSNGVYPSSLPDASSESLIREIAPTPSVRIGKTTIGVEIARDAAAIRKGLSGRISLDASRGMLFVFSKPARYRFWMPDMHFPIDIIWIAGGQVAAIDENAAPEDDLANPRFYTPPQPVTHVLEVNAGFAKKQNINIGNPVTLPH